MTANEIRKAFEDKAYSGYVSHGVSMTDGHYAPESRTAFVRQMRNCVPLAASFFRYDTEFRPTDEELAAYNATFEVGASWRPTHLDLAVNWEGKGWKSYEVTGTRHAFYLLRKLATRRGFRSALLNDMVVDFNGYLRENVISLDADDITGSDRHGKGRALLNRTNSNYDLQRDLLEAEERQRVLDREETESDRAAWRAQDA